MRALMITKFVPLPDDSGGKQRSLAIARRLAERGQLVLCAYDDGHADRRGIDTLGIDLRTVPWRPTPPSAARGALRTRSVTTGRFWSPALAAEVRRAAAQGPLDLLQVEYLQMAPYARGIAATRRVLDLHNVESALMSSYARVRRPPLSLAFALEAAALARLERAAVTAFDTVVVVSEGERTRLAAGPRSVMVCPNGYDMADPVAPAPGAPTVVFVATLGWAPNTDAALWLGRQIWPEVRRRVPDARLLLVGRDPPPAVRSLGSGSVEVSGTVADVRPYLAQAHVAVAPLRSGGGSRLKVLEALAVGRPVVATSIGVDGLEDLVGRGVVVADDTRSFADAVVMLLAHPDAATALGAEGRRAVAGGHSWQSALEPLLAEVTP